MRTLLTLFAAVGWVVAAAACGRPFAVVEGSGGATTGTTSSGGATASTTSASAGTGGSGGATAQCKPGVLGECPDGSYCESGALACRPCADLSRFHFAQPSPIDPSPPTGATTVFYPRTNADDGALYFTYVDKSGTIPRRRLVDAPKKLGGLGWGTWSFLGQPIGSDGQESGPLYLHDASMLAPLVDASKIDTSKPVLLFDSNRDGATTHRIYAANLEGSEAASVALPSGKHDTDIAAAPAASPPRFYWLSDANALVQRLVTATATSSAATEVKIRLDNGCETSAVEAPWVSRDGKHLLFAAAYPAPSTCAPAVGGTKHLFIAKMNDGAQVPNEPAKRIFAEDDVSYDATPAPTPDACVLLFSRFDAAANGRLHAAIRD